jgi:hypothetical protein
MSFSPSSDQNMRLTLLYQSHKVSKSTIQSGKQNHISNIKFWVDLREPLPHTQVAHPITALVLSPEEYRVIGSCSQTNESISVWLSTEMSDKQPFPLHATSRNQDNTRLPHFSQLNYSYQNKSVSNKHFKARRAIVAARDSRLS